MQELAPTSPRVGDGLAVPPGIAGHSPVANGGNKISTLSES